MQFYGHEWTDQERALAEVNARERTHVSGRRVRFVWDPSVNPAYEHDPLDDLLGPPEPKEIDGFSRIIDDDGFEWYRRAIQKQLNSTHLLFSRLQEPTTATTDAVLLRYTSK